MTYIRGAKKTTESGSKQMFLEDRASTDNITAN